MVTLCFPDGTTKLFDNAAQVKAYFESQSPKRSLHWLDHQHGIALTDERRELADRCLEAVQKRLPKANWLTLEAETILEMCRTQGKKQC
jgi:hypothetical protein